MAITASTTINSIRVKARSREEPGALRMDFFGFMILPRRANRKQKSHCKWMAKIAAWRSCPFRATGIVLVAVETGWALLDRTPAASFAPDRSLLLRKHACEWGAGFPIPQRALSFAVWALAN